MGSYENFAQRFIDSRPALFRVAEWLHEFDYYIAIPPMFLKKKHERTEDYQDHGDMFITKNDGPRKRIEVKGLSVSFTDAMDWPFRDVIVSNKAAVDRGANEVNAYISLSADMDHIVIVKADTREHWYVEKRTPKTTGVPEDFYLCPIELVTFKDITRKKES